MSFPVAMKPIRCAGCGQVNRGDPHEVMETILHPERGIVWAAHGNCAHGFFREARRRVLPIVRRMTRHDARVWQGYADRLTSRVLHHPGRFTEVLQDVALALGAADLNREMLESIGATEVEFTGWFVTISEVLDTFNLGPRPRLPDPPGPQLRLVPTTPPPPA